MVNDRLARFALLSGALGAVLWVVSLFVLEGAGNPAGPSGGEEIAEFYRNHRTAILIASTLHVLGGFFFLWFVAALRSILDARGAASWLTTATLVGGIAGGALLLGMTGGQSTGRQQMRSSLPQTPRSSSGGWPTDSSWRPRFPLRISTR
jgi:hypothetical protein